MNQFLSTFIFYFYFVIYHNYNKILKSSWLSTILIGPLLSAVLLRKLTNNKTG